MKTTEKDGAQDVPSTIPRVKPLILKTPTDSRKLIQKQLVILLHSHACLKKDLANSAKRCNVPNCSMMQEVWLHIKKCRIGPDCPHIHCSSSLKILAHWKHCKDPECAVCQLVRLKGAKQFELHTQRQQSRKEEVGVPMPFDTTTNTTANPMFFCGTGQSPACRRQGLSHHQCQGHHQPQPGNKAADSLDLSSPSSLSSCINYSSDCSHTPTRNSSCCNNPYHHHDSHSSNDSYSSRDHHAINLYHNVAATAAAASSSRFWSHSDGSTAMSLAMMAPLRVSFSSENNLPHDCPVGQYLSLGPNNPESSYHFYHHQNIEPPQRLDARCLNNCYYGQLNCQPYFSEKNGDDKLKMITKPLETPPPHLLPKRRPFEDQPYTDHPCSLLPVPSAHDVRRAYEQLGIPCPVDALQRLMATLPGGICLVEENQTYCSKLDKGVVSKMRTAPASRHRDDDNVDADDGIHDSTDDETPVVVVVGDPTD